MGTLWVICGCCSSSYRLSAMFGTATLGVSGIGAYGGYGGYGAYAAPATTAYAAPATTAIAAPTTYAAPATTAYAAPAAYTAPAYTAQLQPRCLHTQLRRLPPCLQHICQLHPPCSPMHLPPPLPLHLPPQLHLRLPLPLPRRSLLRRRRPRKADAASEGAQCVMWSVGTTSFFWWN